MKRVLFVVGVVGLVLPVAAQTRFEPSLAGDATYSDNLGNTPTMATSDTGYRFTLDLPVVRTWQNGELSFRYSPRLYRYQDESDLDRTDHAADLTVNARLSRRSSLDFSTRFSRSQVQGGFISLDDTDVILTGRADRDRLDADLSYGLQVTPRWTWSLATGVGSVNYEAIPGYTALTEDRDQTRISTGFGRQVSQNTTVGMDLRYEENDLDVSADEKIRNANVTVKHQIDQKNSIDLAVGYFSVDAMTGSADRSGAFLTFSFSRDFDQLALATFLGYRPTAGGNLPGTATVANIGASIGSRASKVWIWSVAGVFARRDPASSAANEIDSTVLRGDLTWVPHRKIGVRLTASRNSQIEKNSTSGDIEVNRATLGVVWYLRG